MMNLNHRDKIMIVDDNTNNVKLLIDILKPVGFKLLVAPDGESAIKILSTVLPDLILLDIMMPGIGGFETCNRIKKIPQVQEIPIIFTTALSDAVDKAKGLSLGAVDYITKPFQQEEILARINVHLKLYHLTEELRTLNQNLEERVAQRTAQLSDALDHLKQSQLQLVQYEKMSALGQLVAGVAHEINNPIGFIQSNLTYAGDYIKDLVAHLELYQNKAPETEIVAHAEGIEIDYLITDLFKVLASMETGANRIADISVSLKTFSREDSCTKVVFDIHEGIDSTLLILKHLLKANEHHPAIEVIKEYGELPLITCFPGQLNQVFMNLLANGIDALEESNRGRSFEEIQIHPNRITIRTDISEDNNQALIWIKDNGIGMSEDVKQKIFEQFFTTKAVGKGTGLGMAIAYQIIVEKHGGTIEVNSRLGEGTEFAIALPIGNVAIA
jgi:signal transduction histidine kinase